MDLGSGGCFRGSQNLLIKEQSSALSPDHVKKRELPANATAACWVIDRRSLAFGPLVPTLSGQGFSGLSGVLGWRSCHPVCKGRMECDWFSPSFASQASCSENWQMRFALKPSRNREDMLRAQAPNRASPRSWIESLPWRNSKNRLTHSCIAFLVRTCYKRKKKGAYTPNGAKHAAVRPWAPLNQIGYLHVPNSLDGTQSSFWRSLLQIIVVLFNYINYGPALSWVETHRGVGNPSLACSFALVSLVV